MELMFLLIALPLLGVLINTAGIKHFREKITAIVACGFVGLSLLYALVLFYRMLSLPSAQRIFTCNLYQWFAADTLKVNIGFLLDPLSMVMVLVILFIGFLIHIYSSGYMKGDPGFNRFFIFLNLFIFFMLILVLADNLILTFVGWEGVGLCSYLLIGFWHEKKSAADAGRKAFIVNRIGDAGFILGILLIIVSFGTVNYLELKSLLAGQHAITVVVIGTISILLLIGAMGKSAQFPLHVWLPDAMEGPTPVSALIHAATMVNAGVYLLCRISPFLQQAPFVLPIIATVGLITAIYAALSAFQQKDIKRVLAYSTISQIGFMFVAIGCGIYMAGMFHLAAHGIFKGLLFLGAGAVIHALHGEQDMNKMGGLASRLPVVSKTFFIGLLALGGIFPLSGFFSKDAILWGIFDIYGYLPWLLGFAGALVTAIYCGKLYGMAFSGESASSEQLHVPGKTMTYPLIILSFCAVFLGILGLPLLTKMTFFADFLQTSFIGVENIFEAAGSAAHTQELVIMVFAGISVILVIWRSVILYSKQRTKIVSHEQAHPQAVAFLANGFWMDKLYDIIFVRPFVILSRWSAGFIDQKLVDGIVNGIGNISLSAGLYVAKLQTGYLRSYAGSIVVGIFVFTVIVIWFLKG
jgi:NADH-quinone oxidoreductase subunit L